MMEAKKFNPYEWIQGKKDHAPKLKSISGNYTNSMHEDIVVVVRRGEPA